MRHSSKRDSPSGHVEQGQVPHAGRPMRVKRGANREATGHTPRVSSECRFLAPRAGTKEQTPSRAGARGSPTTAAPGSTNAPQALDREWGHATRATPEVTGDTLSEH